MTLQNWTLWVAGSGISLIALFLAISQYFNVKRRRKIFVVRRALARSFVVLIIIWAVGFYFLVEDTKPLTQQGVEQLFEDYFGEKPPNPTVKKIKTEVEKELAAAFKEKKRRALDLYRQGNEAYKNNRFNESLVFYGAALKIVQTASINLARGNSYFVVSSFHLAIRDYTEALRRYKQNSNRQGEERALRQPGEYV